MRIEHRWSRYLWRENPVGKRFDGMLCLGEVGGVGVWGGHGDGFGIGIEDTGDGTQDLSMISVLHNAKHGNGMG